jgi:hypothetical protein
MFAYGCSSQLCFIRIFFHCLTLVFLWWGLRTLQVASISRRQNARPGTITWHAKFRDPIKDCKSRNEILVQAKQDSILFRNSISFSSGSSITMLIVLNSIPRNIKTSVGSTVLLSARGTPHSLQESWNNFKMSLHCVDPADWLLQWNHGYSRSILVF